MKGQAKRTISPSVDSCVPRSVPSTAAVNIFKSNTSGEDCPVTRQLLPESFTCAIARKVVLPWYLKNFNIEYFCIHQYTFTDDIIILNPLKGVQQYLRVFMMFMIRVIFSKNYSAVYHYFSF